MTVFTLWSTSLFFRAFAATTCITFSKRTPSWTFCSPANFSVTHCASHPITTLISLDDNLKESQNKISFSIDFNFKKLTPHCGHFIATPSVKRSSINCFVRCACLSGALYKRS